MKRRIAALLAWLVAGVAPTGMTGETLQNGIVLPDAWPPRRTMAELRAGEVMRVPYLEQKPDVVPIDVGRQLFVDDFLMLGLFSILHANPRLAGQPKINDVMLGFSRDGFHWHRPFREAVIPVSNEPDTWNYGNVQSVGGGCLIVGDKLYVYATGRNATVESTGLAFFRRDGFASMEAGQQEGTLTTRPVRFSGRRLFVNVAAAEGELRAEVLGCQGKAIAPFTRDNCEPVHADKTLLAVRWKGAEDLSSLSGKPVQFRFHLRNGAIYAFWVSGDSSGASHGYVAAGGPGFTGPTDTVGQAGCATPPDK